MKLNFEEIALVNIYRALNREYQGRLRERAAILLDMQNEELEMEDQKKYALLRKLGILFILIFPSKYRLPNCYAFFDNLTNNRLLYKKTANATSTSACGDCQLHSWQSPHLYL